MSLDINITAKREVEIYERNVTYNLANMYYKCIDKEKGFKKLDGMNCKEALPIINNAIKDMLNNADEYRKLNPKNGWGSYEGLLATLQEMRNCCEIKSLGYKKNFEDKYRANYENTGYETIINFDKDIKEIRIWNNGINTEELQAINEKVKELRLDRRRR